MIWNCHRGVDGSCRRNPVPAAGMMSSAVVRKIVLRPPAMRMKKEDGMRSVAPLRPAMAARVKSSAWGEGELQVDHLDGDDPPVEPHREPAQEAGNRDPQVACRHTPALALPETLVFRVPVRQVSGHGEGILSALCDSGGRGPVTPVAIRARRRDSARPQARDSGGAPSTGWRHASTRCSRARCRTAA